MQSPEGNNLLNEERRRAILEMLQREGRVLVGPLARRFKTSQVTIRKDLDALETRTDYPAGLKVFTQYTG